MTYEKTDNTTPKLKSIFDYGLFGLVRFPTITPEDGDYFLDTNEDI